MIESLVLCSTDITTYLRASTNAVTFDSSPILRARRRRRTRTWDLEP